MIAKMEPRKLLQLLMAKSELNSNSLAAKLDNATTQPQIHKFLNGKAKEPRRATLAPVADYFSIPLDALYDPEVAATVAEQRRLAEPELKQSPPPAREAEAPMPTTSGGQLQAMFDAIPAGSVWRESAYSECFNVLMKAIRATQQAASPPTDDTNPSQTPERRNAAHRSAT